MNPKTMINNLHAQWEQAKAHLAQRCRTCGDINMADQLEKCRMFKGSEGVEELIRLFLSPQGKEFCLCSKFPTLAAFRLFKPYNPERFGIYIDAGEITLRNPETAVLIGHTCARLIYTEDKPLHKVTLLRGATAHVTAGGWSVVGISAENGCKVLKYAKDNAVILC